MGHILNQVGNHIMVIRPIYIQNEKFRGNKYSLRKV